MAPPRMLTVREAASVLRCHPKTVRSHIHDGSLPAATIGRRYLIPESGISHLIRTGGRPRRQGVRPAPPQGTMRAIAREIRDAGQVAA